MNLPSDYVAYTETHPLERFIGESSLRLWTLEEIASINESYDVKSNAPGLLIFGTDGGGEAYGFDTRCEPWPVVRVPFIPMEWASAIPEGASFTDFIQQLQLSSK